MIDSHRSSLMSWPIAVSFTETFALSLLLAIASISRTYSSPAARASPSLVTLSPSKSSDAVMPCAFNRWTAATADSTVSPATNRDAIAFASRLFRTRLETNRAGAKGTGESCGAFPYGTIRVVAGDRCVDPRDRKDMRRRIR